MSKKTDFSLTPTADAKKIFQAIYKKQNKKDARGDEVAKIKVSELVSKMAFYYEKVRNTVDYKEENLLRKNAIERILKRQIIIEGAMSLKDVNSFQISKHLLTELIRAGYLPNNKIPETKIGEIATVIERYLKLKAYSLTIHKNLKMQQRTDLSYWIISMLASDIEEKIGRSEVDKTVISCMYNAIEPYIKLPDNSQFEKDREIQIYIAIHRGMLKFDREMIGFILFKYYNANWDHASDNQIEDLAKNIFALQNAIEKQIEHPLVGQLKRIIDRYTVFFTILLDVVEDDCVGIYDCFSRDPKAFPRHIRRVCETRYKSNRRKLWRAGLRSLLYILITKTFLVILLEIPVIKWFGDEVNLFSLIINISFPALLLFFVILFTRLPSQENSNKIIEGIEEVVFEEHQRKESFKLKNPTTQSSTMNSIFGLVYFVTFFLSFGAVVYALQRINFNFVSIVIFLFFLALISFFGIRIRRGTRELIVLPPKENIFSFVLDFFYVPIVAVGKWLSEKFDKVNVFVFILDFIIEAPFKIFIEITEEWTKYVKERKDKIV